MGKDVDHTEFSREDRTRYRLKVRRCLDVFERMLAQSQFDFERPMTGVEIELNLVDEKGDPALRNAEVLDAVSHADFQTELGQFNVEINVQPRTLAGDAAVELEQSVRDTLNHAEEKARTTGSHMVMVGILPTLTDKQLNAESLSHNPRYALLNDQIFAARGEDLHITIDGVQRLSTYGRHGRAGGGLHQRAVPPAGEPVGVPPVLERGAGDRRRAGRAGRQLAVLPRQGAVAGDPDPAVRAGHRHPVGGAEGAGRAAAGVVRGAVDHLHLRPVRGERPLLPGAAAAVRRPRTRWRCSSRGDVPQLRELRLHNGTVYRWNRPVYDVVRGKPHLRVENRVLPAGPTVVDIMANARLLLRDRAGARRRRPATVEPDVVRRGRGELPQPAPGTAWRRRSTGRAPGRCRSTELVLRRLLPMAAEGLDRWEVSPARPRPAARHHRAALPHRPQRRLLAGRPPSTASTTRPPSTGTTCCAG